MDVRWRALALLFCVRTVMAFQFQTVAALSPFIEAEFGVGLGTIGFLFGLYMAPGLLLAIPGATLAHRFGEKRIVVVSLWMMATGCAVMAFAPGWSAAVTGRLIAGVGGILMNVVLTKMVTDWFEGREIATAMSIFIVSWPAGIALALLVLPPVASSYGLASGYFVGAALAVVGALAFVGYRTAPDGARAPVGHSLSRRAWLAAGTTGATWGFLNAALAVVFGFGVALLVGRGVDIESAGQVTSLTMIALAAVGPIGGMIADKTGRYMVLITSSVLSMAGVLALIVAGFSSVWLFVLFGLACGLCAGPVMSLAGLYIPQSERARGMGIFFTVYYACILAAPPLAGWVAEIAGRTEAAFAMGIGFSALTLLSLAGVASSASKSQVHGR